MTKTMTHDYNPPECLTTRDASALSGYDVTYARQLTNQRKVRAIKRGHLPDPQA